MIFFRDLSDFQSDVPTAVTIGKFDGLHRGHLKLLKKIREEGADCTRIMLRINPGSSSSVLSSDEFASLAGSEGIDIIVNCPFTEQLRTMSPETFIREILVGKMHASHVCVGEDFRFGKDRKGDAFTLTALCQSLGIRTSVVEKVCFRGSKISSSKVRDAIREGDMELVSALLGRHFPISGTVVHGDHIGTGMGMPTINIIPQPGKLLPPYGVYFSQIRSDGEIMNGITNIGVRPTVDGSRCRSETYLYDVSKDLYGHSVMIQLLRFVRPEKKFSSLEELRSQAARDMEAGREYFLEQGIMGCEPGPGRVGTDLSGSGSGCEVL